ncbi:hypothetical protein [Thiolapillus sp.]|uniref:hypothetical protein n=1 Tax=Thiolapillus sp. TaxID=2017437 RepID=UPI003AF7829A
MQQQIHSAAGTSGSSARRTWRRDGHAQRAALAELRAGGLALSIFLTQWWNVRKCPAAFLFFEVRHALGNRRKNSASWFRRFKKTETEDTEIKKEC